MDELKVSIVVQYADECEKIVAVYLTDIEARIDMENRKTLALTRRRGFWERLLNDPPSYSVRSVDCTKAMQ